MTEAKPDEKPQAKMIKTIYLKAPRERVWFYLTDPEKLARWFHEGQGKMVVGGDYALLSEHKDREDPRLCWGRVLEMDKPNRLVYTFTHEWLKGVETTVEWVLTDIGEGTQLTMTHTGFDLSSADTFTECSDHDKGWDEMFQRLRQVVS